MKKEQLKEIIYTHYPDIMWHAGQDMLSDTRRAAETTSVNPAVWAMWIGRVSEAASALRKTGSFGLAGSTVQDSRQEVAGVLLQKQAFQSHQ